MTSAFDSLQSDHEEGTLTKIERVWTVVSEGLWGIHAAAVDGLQSHKTELFSQAVISAGLGVGISYLNRRMGVGSIIGRAIGCSIAASFIKDVFTRGEETVGALIDAGESDRNLEHNRAIIRDDIGHFALDALSMAAASVLAVGATRFALSRPRVFFRTMPTGSVGSTDGTAISESIPEHSVGSSSPFLTRNNSSGTSQWMADSLPLNQFPTLEHNIQTEIAVVGGGTGSYLAHRLASEGARVVLVDGGEIAGGNTTTSGMAGINTRSLDAGFVSAAQELGMSNAARLVQFTLDGQRAIETLAQRVGAKFVPTKSYSIAADAADLKEEAELAGRLDPHTTFLTEEDARKLRGSPGGALVIANESSLDPVDLAVRALNDARTNTGKLDVFANSPVLSMSVDTGVHLFTPHGRIDADKVVFATGQPIQQFDGLEVPVIRKRVFALSARLGQGQSLTGNYFDDTTFTFFRPVEGGRSIVFGGGGTKLRELSATDTPLSKLTPALQQYFPGAQPFHTWYREIDIAPDRRGYIDESPKYPGKVYVASTFGGTGLVLSGVSQNIIPVLMRGEGHPFPEAFGLNRPAAKLRK